MFLKAFIYWTYENTLKNYDAVNCWGIVCCKNSAIEQTHKISTVVDFIVIPFYLIIEQTHKISTVVDFQAALFVNISNRLIKFLLL